MTRRPTARLLARPPDPAWAPLSAPGAAQDLTGAIVTGVVDSPASATAALDAVMLGADLCVHVSLPRPADAEFRDQLRRIAEVLETPDPQGISDEEAVLVRALRRGADLQEAASQAGISRRTAARRLATLRRRHGVETLAELLVALDP